MRKYRVNTTISNRHHEILKKQAEKFGTQQSVLEHALDGLEKNNSNQNQLSPDEKLWMKIDSEITDIFTILPKELTKILFETADKNQMEDYFKNAKQVEFAVELYNNKQLKDCSLQEVIDGMIQNIKMQSSTDTLNFKDHREYYTINMTHRLGIKAAHALVIMNESALNSYRAEFESHYSERNIYFKIFK